MRFHFTSIERELFHCLLEVFDEKSGLIIVGKQNDIYGLSGRFPYFIESLAFSKYSISMLKLFLKEKDYGDTLMRGTSVKINGEIRDFPVLIMEHLAPYFNFKKTVQIMESIEGEEDSSINSALEKVKQVLWITPFMINGPNMNMTIGPYNTLFIIEDYKKEVN